MIEKAKAFKDKSNSSFNLIRLKKNEKNYSISLTQHHLKGSLENAFKVSNTIAYTYLTKITHLERYLRKNYSCHIFKFAELNITREKIIATGNPAGTANA